MKVAVTYENGQIFQHFGHTSYFKIYDIDNNQIINSSVVGTNGEGHGALATFLTKNGVSTLICGGIGAGAKTALAEVNITLYPGVTGSADEAVNDLLAGRLSYNPDTECKHHEHESGEHNCGGHSCTKN